MFKLQTFGGVCIYLEENISDNESKALENGINEEGLKGYKSLSKRTSYNGHKIVLVLSYLIAKARPQSRSHLSSLCWNNQKPPTEGLNRGLNNLKRSLRLAKKPTDYFLQELYQGKDRYLRFSDYYLHKPKHPPSKPKHVQETHSGKIIDLPWQADFLYLDYALEEIDKIVISGTVPQSDKILFEHILIVAKYYQGVFLLDVEKKVPASKVKRAEGDAKKYTEGFSSRCLQWLDDKRCYYANRVLDSILNILKGPAKASRQIATDLLSSLLRSHPLCFFAPGIVADGYSLLEAQEKEDVLPRLIHHFEQSRHPKYLEVFYALQLQGDYTLPALRLACDACGLTDVVALKAEYADDDWFDTEGKHYSADSRAERDLEKEHDTALGFRLKGQVFLQAALAQSTPNLKANLLKSLFISSSLLTSSTATLFSFVWHYWQLKGDFAALPQVKLLSVLRQQVQDYACQGNFDEVKEICVAWEKERVRCKQAYEPTMHFYHAYSLERQGKFPEAEKILKVYKPTQGVQGILHEVLRLVLLEQQKRTSEEKNTLELLDSLYEQVKMSRELAYIRARAEILTLKGRLAFYKSKSEKLTAHEGHYEAIGYWKEATKEWQACRDIVRELGVQSNIACAYDQAKRVGAALKEYLAAQDRLQHYPSLRQSLVAFRLTLNQLILCSKHQEKLANIPEWEELPLGLVDIALPNLVERQQQLIYEIQAYKQDLPGLLSKALYNMGYIQKKRAKYQEAIDWFKQTLHILNTAVNDSQLFGCSHGEIGNCQLELLKESGLLYQEKNVYISCDRSAGMSGDNLVDNSLYTDTQIYLAQASKSSLQKAIMTLEIEQDPNDGDYRQSLKELQLLMPQLFDNEQKHS